MEVVGNSLEYKCFSLESNECLFEYNGTVYTSLLKAIVDNCMPKTMKGFALSISNEQLRNILLSDVRHELIEDVLYSKFTQHKSLADKLLSTGNKIIAIDIIGYSLMNLRTRLRNERYE